MWCSVQLLNMLYESITVITCPVLLLFNCRLQTHLEIYSFCTQCWCPPVPCLQKVDGSRVQQDSTRGFICAVHLPAIVTKPSGLCGLMQFMPLLAISPRFFNPLFSRYHNALLEFDAAARVLIPHQHFTFIPLLMVAKFGELPAWHHPLGT